MTKQIMPLFRRIGSSLPIHGSWIIREFLMVHDYWFTDPSNEFFRQQEGCERHLNACLVGEFDKDLPIHLADYLEMKFNEWLQNSSRVEP